MDSFGVFFMKADCVLIQSKEVNLQPSEAENISGTNDYKSFVTQGKRKSLVSSPKKLQMKE